MKIYFTFMLLTLFPAVNIFAANWELIDTNTAKLNRPKNLSMQWADDNRGVVYHTVGNTNLGLKITQNGGDTWKILNIDSIGKSLGLQSSNIFYLVDYNQENLVIALDSAKFLFSNDNAKTWSLKTFPYGKGVTFLDYDKSGKTGILYETNDQGIPLYLYTANMDLTEFTKIEIPVKYKWYTLRNFVVYNDSLIACIGSDSNDWAELIWFNKGVWTEYELPHNTCNVSFVDGLVGFSTTFLELELSVYKTTNSGKNWDKIYSNYPSTISRCFGMLNDKVGMITGSNYKLLKTIDGGYTWNKEQISNYPIDDQGTYGGFVVKGITLMNEKSYILANESLYRNDEITNIIADSKANWINNNLYPNPIEKGGNLSIRLDDLNFKSIQISTIEGKVLYSFDSINSQKLNDIVNFNLPRELSSGIYILKLNFEKQYQSSNLIVR